jgi:Domain of unknown function (DUF4091)
MRARALPRCLARLFLAASSVAASSFASVAHAAPTARRVVYLDDGEKIARDADHEMAPSPWPGEIELFALAGETVAFQAVLDVGPEPVAHAAASIAAFSPLAARVETFAEEFVPIARPSGNDREPGSLAFTPRAAPPASGPRSFVASFADPLLPATEATAPAGERTAIWIDVTIPIGARAGTYRSAIEVKDGDALLDTRSIVLRVAATSAGDARRLDYDNRAITVYYDSATLAKRMGEDVRERAEVQLRQLLHAHHLSAIHEVTSPELEGPMALDFAALDGSLYTTSRGYEGPGAGIGEGIFAIGAYGALGDASLDKAEIVGRFAKRLRERKVFESTETFVYAIDEDCASPRARTWRDQLAFVPDAKGVRVGVTCGDDPMEQAADLVMMTADRWDPDLAAAAKTKAKKVWAYNGQRPYAGPMMLDVPAVDLRANAWIAARYEVERWYYWESIFWLDANKGGKGGAEGHDPFRVAETFHNKSGDYANGDGILLYPGTQRSQDARRIGAGMKDLGKPVLLPSVRLKNLRRGAQDLGWVRIARQQDPDGTEIVVRSMIPRALHGMKDEQPTWPDRGASWLAARRRLLAILDGPAKAAAPRSPEAERSVDGRSPHLGGCAGMATFGALLALVVLAIVRGVLKSRRGRPS